MKIRHFRRVTVGWCWLYWRQWGVTRGADSTCYALGPLGVTVWRKR